MAGEYTAATPLTPGTILNANQMGRAYRIACSSAGFFRLIMPNGSFYDVYANPGTGGEDGIIVAGVAASGAPQPQGSGVVTLLA